jgi:DNA polymerase III subunit alpha
MSSNAMGRDQVAQIITFGKMKARAVLKDVGRVLQMPYGQTDRLSKLVPSHPTDPWTLARTLGQGKDKDGKRYEGVPEFIAERDRDPKVKRLIEIALQLEGLPRHSSTHAAGVVIGDRPLSQLVPLYRDPRSDMAVTQFEMKAVEKAGLVKFDFLGLKTLSVLDRAAKLLKDRGIEVDWLDLPLDDPEVYKLLARGDTVGVFQFESEGMRRALGQVRPDCFADIVALGALYRPGPMDNIPSFAARKHKREEVALLHPLMEPILRETYGIIVYQEQVMQIARELAGYSLGEADLLRRAMGKKIHAEMVAQKERFAEGAAKNDIEKDTASAIFDLVLKFANYGFNKSHAAAYALVSFQTAWLKAHYPVEFYAASMAYDITNTDRLAVFAEDARRSGVPMLPPCINASQADFSVETTPDGTLAVRYALAALKNVGEKAMEAVVANRGDGYRALPAFAKCRSETAQQAPAGKPDCGGLFRWRRAEPRRGLSARRSAYWGRRRQPPRRGNRRRRPCSGNRPASSTRGAWRCWCRPAPAGPWPRRCNRKRMPLASISPAIRWRRGARCSMRKGR